MVKKILIVEDEVDLLAILEIHFKNAGWQTQTAANGRIALQQIEHSRPDVILSDINMPELDGMQLLQELDRTGSEIPLVFITGFRSLEKMKMAWRFCAFDFLDKPTNTKNMLQVMENAYHYGKEYVQSARKRFYRLRKVS